MIPNDKISIIFLFCDFKLYSDIQNIGTNSFGIKRQKQDLDFTRISYPVSVKLKRIYLLNLTCFVVSLPWLINILKNTMPVDGRNKFKMTAQKLFAEAKKNGTLVPSNLILNKLTTIRLKTPAPNQPTELNTLILENCSGRQWVMATELVRFQLGM